MNRNILCGLLIALAFTTACANQKKGTKKGAKATTTTTSTSAQSNISSVRMHRTVCFGKCPEYILTINSDGKATYEGRHFATYQGIYEKQFDAKKAQALFNEYSRFRVDTCSSKYETIPDMAGLHYEITYKGKDDEQKITNANSPFAPKYLKGLAEEMDKQFPIDGTWKKVGNWEQPKR